MRFSADSWSYHYYVCLSASAVTCIRMSWPVNKGIGFSNLKIETPKPTVSKEITKEKFKKLKFVKI